MSGVNVAAKGHATRSARAARDACDQQHRVELVDARMHRAAAEAKTRRPFEWLEHPLAIVAGGLLVGAILTARVAGWLP